MIYAEKFLKKRYDEGVQHGLEQGLERGLEEGLEQGMERGRSAGLKEANARWEKWYRRRIEAEAKGEEPPPPPNASERG